MTPLLLSTLTLRLAATPAGRLRASDARRLAGLPPRRPIPTIQSLPPDQRAALYAQDLELGRAMAALGWQRSRARITGGMYIVYIKGPVPRPIVYVHVDPVTGVPSASYAEHPAAIVI
jgi:hypothetical protein